MAVAAALLALSLAGCSPEYDWREIRTDEGAFIALFPARPRIDARVLGGAHAGVVMHQWSAKVGETLFAVNYADFIALDDAAVTGLRDALVRNIRGAVASERSFGRLGARETTATGRINGTPAYLRLHEYRRGARLYQVIVLGKLDDASVDQLDTFFASFKLLPVRLTEKPAARRTAAGIAPQQ